MDISVVIPTCERDEIFNKTLESVFNSTAHLNCEIIVVNDSKKSRPFIPKSFKNVVLYSNSGQGCTSARNLGAMRASSPYLLFIDDDFIVTKYSIDRILHFLKKYPCSAFNVAWEYPGKLYQIILQNQFGRYLKYHLKFTSLKEILGKHWQDKEMFLHPEGMGSGFFAIRKDCFFKAGGYNEEFVFAADRDMAKRLKYSNIDVYIIPSIKVYHNEADKVTLRKFLKRRKYGIRKAIEYNIIEEYKYSKIQSYILCLLSKIKPFIFLFIYIIPNFKMFDKLYYMCANVLFIVSLYEGYSRNRY